MRDEIIPLAESGRLCYNAGTMAEHETILAIEELTNYDADPKDYSSYDGWQITTNKQIIRLLISNCQSCCENWGYLLSEDDTSAFVGSNLLDIKRVDEDMAVASIRPNLPEYGWDSGGAVFINIETSAGLLQFVAYNSHNGYYGHTVLIGSETLVIHEDV